MNESYRIYSENSNKPLTIYSEPEYFTVVLLQSGSFSVTLESKTHLVSMDDMLLFKPNQKTQLIPNDSMALLICSFPSSFLKDFSNESLNFEESFLYVPYDIAIIHSELQQIIVLRNLLNRITSLELESYRFGLDYYEKCLFSSFLVLFLRCCIQSDSYHKAKVKKQLILDDVFIYLKRHYQQDISLKQLEDTFFISSEHLSRRFKKETGLSIHQYILSLRLSQAKREILKGIPISQLYSQCGFSSYTHFFKAFKKATGLTPNQYKSQYQKKREI